MRRREPGLAEDAKNVSVIVASACVAALITAGFMFADEPPQPIEVRVQVRDVPEAPEPPEPPEAPPPPRAPVVTSFQGSNRLYGTVTTRSGADYTGYIRWDRNEGSWSDLLEATKDARGGDRLTGIRFGHVDRIDVLDRSSARFTLKSGEMIDLNGHATDLGSSLRALIVDDPTGAVHEFHWRDLETVDFEAAPTDVMPREGRLYGTLRSRDGQEFTGYVTWDVDEIYTSDVLDGDIGRRDVSIPFGDIARIERNDRRSALVVMKDGEEMVLDGSNDVDSSIRGISISDPGLGQVKLGWDEFDAVTFHPAQTESAYSDFDGGTPLHGTVVTIEGEEISGTVRWDDDEAFSWEPLNGSVHGLSFDIELSNVERIERTSRGAAVTLRDGRTFELSGSNDVDSDNDGIVVDDGAHVTHVAWRAFRELRLER